MTRRLEPFRDTPEVVALVGPRRSGKTTVLHQVMSELVRSGVPDVAMLHINLEEPALAPGLGVELLDRIYDTYREEVFPEGKAYLFLDEVQRIPSWERWVRARNESEHVKIFVAGSSASLMSRELATLLTGRHVTFSVYPLSFAELLRFKGIKPPTRPKLAGTPPQIQNALGEYLRWGGFPEVVLAESEHRRHTLLKAYFDDLLFKDVALRHSVRDMQALRALAVHLLTQTGNMVSLQRTARAFNVSLDLARSYLGHLQEAYLVEHLPYYSLKVTERQRHPHKVHAVDLGLRNAVCLSETPDRGRLSETAVHNALRRDPANELYYWKADGEIDLLVRRGNRVEALVQVVYEGLADGAVKKRETAPLAAGAAKYPDARRVLVVGRGPGPDLADVTVLPLWRLLLEGLDL